jgi:hypothetical protein
MTGCTERLRVSIGTRIPSEMRGASSVQITERFSKISRGEDLSMVATLIDFSYLRAVTRERNRSIEQEREAYQGYLRRQTSFYVYLLLHQAESCRSYGDPERHRGRGRLDMRSWDFTLETSDGREHRASEIDPRPTQLAPTGGCLVQGYVHFDGNIPLGTQWVSLDATSGEDNEEISAVLRWDLEPWTPERRRRPENSPADRDDS